MITALIGAGSDDGLWGRIRQAAYTESGTPTADRATAGRANRGPVPKSGLRSPAVVDLDPVPDLRVRGYAVDVEISAIQHASNRCPA
jgi:hypothetical protein